MYYLKLRIFDTLVASGGGANFLELRHGEVRRIPLPRTRVNRGDKKRKSRAQKEPDSRLTSHYLRNDRRTVVTRLVVPFPLETSSVSVLNSVPRYFMGFRALMPSDCGAGPFGPTAWWLMSFLLSLRLNAFPLSCGFPALRDPLSKRLP